MRPGRLVTSVTMFLSRSTDSRGWTAIGAAFGARYVEDELAADRVLMTDALIWSRGCSSDGGVTSLSSAIVDSIVGGASIGSIGTGLARSRFSRVDAASCRRRSSTDELSGTSSDIALWNCVRRKKHTVDV